MVTTKAQAQAQAQAEAGAEAEETCILNSRAFMADNVERYKEVGHGAPKVSLFTCPALSGRPPHATNASIISFSSSKFSARSFWFSITCERNGIDNIYRRVGVGGGGDRLATVRGAAGRPTQN